MQHERPLLTAFCVRVSSFLSLGGRSQSAVFNTDALVRVGLQSGKEKEERRGRRGSSSGDDTGQEDREEEERATNPSSIIMTTAADTYDVIVIGAGISGECVCECVWVGGRTH